MTSFKEDYARFQKMGAEIVAISSDTLESHEKFAEKLGGIPFPLLSDVDMQVIRSYGVLNDRGSGARRSVFVLDSDGRILHANTQYSVADPRHYEEIFEALRASVPE